MYGMPGTELRTLHLVVSHGKPISTWSEMNGGKPKKVKYCKMRALAITPATLDCDPKLQMIRKLKHASRHQKLWKRHFFQIELKFIKHLCNGENPPRTIVALIRQDRRMEKIIFTILNNIRWLLARLSLLIDAWLLLKRRPWYQEAKHS